MEKVIKPSEEVLQARRTRELQNINEKFAKRKRKIEVRRRVTKQQGG